MSRSIARVPTENASRYLQQLCKHWAHRFTVTFDPQKGDIDFGEGQNVALAATDKTLDITITGAKADDLPQLEDVVARHIVRFAFREELVFDWSREE